MPKRNRWAGAALVVVLYAAGATGSPGQTYTVLADLDGQTGGLQDDSWQGSLVQGTDGNFYGTGALSIYSVTPEGAFTVLHTFPHFQYLGNLPLLQAVDGDFYGTNFEYDINGGTFFRISPRGKLTTLYTFSLCSAPLCPDGDVPDTGLVQASDGSFYGTTLVGGAGDFCPIGQGCGTIFKVTPMGGLTTLYNFCSQAWCSDGFDAEAPYGALVPGPGGDLYGTTRSGGISDTVQCGYGCGTVFKIGQKGDLTTLYTFCTTPGCPDGAGPLGLVLGSDGTFYGTTGGGGASDVGTIFRITPSGVLTTIYNSCALPNCADGEVAYGLIQGSDRNFYGVTGAGGARHRGTIFRITPAGVLTTLYNFCSLAECADGHNPSGLVQGTDGNFYGTTALGGVNKRGVFYRLATGLSPSR